MRILNLRNRILTFPLLLLCLALPSYSLTFPQDNLYSLRTEYLLDAGYLWSANSIYHPFGLFSLTDSANTPPEDDNCRWLYQFLNEIPSGFNSAYTKDKTLTGLSQIGLNTAYYRGEDFSSRGLAVQPYLWSGWIFRQHYYLQLYGRTTNEQQSLPHFTGVPRDIARAGMNTGEIDQAVAGYRNSWVNLEYGRFREIHGPLTEDNLFLSGNSPAYERLMLQLDFGKISYRYFFGYLETIEDTAFIDRYITSRSLQYSNRKNFVLGVEEVSILAGPDRNVDFAFLNPLSLHLEIDLNNRTNMGGRNYANAVWNIFADWLIRQNLRASFSLSLDEIKLEWQERAEGSPDIFAYLLKTAWTPVRNPFTLTLGAKYIRLSTYYGQHNYPYVNAVTRGEFIGNSLGNDADLLAASARIIFDIPLILETEIGMKRRGDNSLLENPYVEFNNPTIQSFPSGEMRKNFYLKTGLNYHLLKRCDIFFNSVFDLYHKGEDSSLLAWNIGLHYRFPEFIYSY